MNGLSTYLSFAGPVMEELFSVEEKQKEWKKKIQVEWHKSKEYPRKKKKRVRKELILDWKIASWNIFDI